MRPRPGPEPPPGFSSGARGLLAQPCEVAAVPCSLCLLRPHCAESCSGGSSHALPWFGGSCDALGLGAAGTALLWWLVVWWLLTHTEFWAAVTLLLWWLLLWWLLSQPCLGGRGHSPGVLQVLQRAQVSERAAPGWPGARRKEAAAARAGAPLLRAGCRHLGEEWVAGSVVPAGLTVSAVPRWEGSRVGRLPETELWPCCPSQSGQPEAAGL